MPNRSVLISLSGLPGTGKSSIAAEISSRLPALWLRIDSIEQALRDSGRLVDDIEDAGYRAAMAVAADNLALGHPVIADCVNPWMLTRDLWCDIGRKSGADVIEIELICSDPIEHRRRIEARRRETSNRPQPDWEAVENRDYREWTRDRIRIDTAGRSMEDCARAALRAIESGVTPAARPSSS